jgi:tetratricopeptide (TPR) repeat protein
MARRMQIQETSLFIASPGDTVDARNRVREAVERVNRLVGRPNRIIVNAIGWEDIPSGRAKRAQDRINPYVKRADIFVGILNKRFGSPTGIAESGTKEEYLLITKRWKHERPRPEVMMYFKKLPVSDLSRPTRQLTKVLRFKQQISKTDLYHEFTNIKQLGEMVEDAIAKWIYGVGQKQERSAKIGPERLAAADLDFLASAVRDNQLAVVKLSTRTADRATKRLKQHGLLKLIDKTYKPSNSTEGFLSIVKHLNNEKNYRALLQSEYYQGMLQSCLPSLVESRFHCKPSNEDTFFLRLIAQISPSAADFLLFGDTELYDNLAEHAKSIGKEEISQKMIRDNIAYSALLCYTNDSENGRILDRIGNRDIAGQIIKLQLAVAYANEKAFEALVAKPLMRVKLLGSIEKGQMVTGGHDLLLNQGVIMMHLNQPELAIDSFDRVINSNANAKIRGAAFNNRGPLLRDRGKLPEALQALEQAAELDPDRPEILKNLVSLKGAIKSNSENTVDNAGKQ